MTIEVSAPIDTTGLTRKDMVALRDQTREVIAATVEGISDSYDASGHQS